MNTIQALMIYQLSFFFVGGGGGGDLQVRRGRQLSPEVQLGSLASGLPEWVEFNQLPLSKDLFFVFVFVFKYVCEQVLLF